VCFEHSGDPREWYEDEIRFCGEIADQFVQVLATAERQDSDEQIRRLAFYDPLTELANRRLLHEALNHELEIARRRGVYGSLLFLDLDNFKTLNDSLGHAIGDELLVQVSRRLRKALRGEDTAARLGGDEFVVVVSGEHESKRQAMDQALTVAKKVQASIGESYQLHGYDHVVTTSMGITIFPEAHETAEDLLKQADVAMYRAKEEGRNTISFYNPEMQKQAERRLLLEKQLRLGIARGEFETHFQIQVDGLGAPAGVEALLRWNHPGQRLVTPEEFIPTAEETGLILELGKVSLGAACRLSTRYDLGRIAVNISPLQFRQPDFVDTVTLMLEQTHANPSALMVEVTEGIVIERIDDTIGKLKALKELGIKISIDDFGTGYSSLAYLKQLPLDQLKICSEFVRDITTDPNDAVIVETIISMAKHLGLEVVAEGVETREQVTFLGDRGCSIFQGYYFSSPVPEAEFDVCLSAMREHTRSRERVYSK
jgi:diguanylate cyclase (GGDEF)-like protein